MTTTKYAMDLLTRLENKFTIGDDCWLWTASLNGYGYGHLVHLGKSLQPHRVLYELLIGPIPEGLDLDHLCRVRSCVRPDHLEPVTRQVNIKRGSTGSKTHCRHGHSLADALIHHGRRECRECNRLRSARQRRWKRGQYAN